MRNPDYAQKTVPGPNYLVPNGLTQKIKLAARLNYSRPKGGSFMNKVLVVDDDPTVLTALAALLDCYDFPVEQAPDLSSVEALLAKEFFPVVIADVRLRSDEEGFRLVEAVRRLSPRTQVVSMTGYASADMEERLRGLGSRLVLRKPFADDALIGVVRELIDEVAKADAEAGDDDLERIYLETLPTLRAVFRRYRFEAEDAEELMQEAWCLFLEKRRQVRTPRTWLSGTIANLCRQEIGRRVRARDRAGELVDAGAHLAQDEVLAVQQALSRLDPRTRVLCELIGIERRSYDEVSAAVGMPLGSVGPTYIRAKAKLRKALG